VFFCLLAANTADCKTRDNARLESETVKNAGVETHNLKYGTRVVCPAFSSYTFSIAWR